MQKPNLQEMSLIELKALAYDIVILLENTRNSLTGVQQEINKKIKEQQNNEATLSKLPRE